MTTLRLVTQSRTPLRSSLLEAHDWLVAAPAFPRGLAPYRRLQQMAFEDGAGTRSLVRNHPVILVHGCIGNPTTWVPLVRRLHRRGVANMYAFGYASVGVDVPELAERLLRQVQREVGTEPVHLVGHSLGGLIVRYFAQELADDTTVATLATIATPHRGARLARLLPTALGCDLRPGSPLLRQLARQPVRETPFTTYSTDRDLLVSRESATLQSTNVANVSIPGYGHLSILNAPPLADHLAFRLHQAEQLSPRIPRQPSPPDLRAVRVEPSLP
jgi:pimeloyl-ACP methyl ester carboxylesterase